MGVDYACVIGLGVHFPDAFIRRCPRSVVEKIENEGNESTVFVTTLYKNMSVDDQTQLIPPFSIPEHTRESILEDVWNTLCLSDAERIIIMYLLKEQDDLVVGSLIQHYAW